MGIRHYLVQKAGYSLLVFIVIVVFNFFVFRLMPGDPTKLVLDPNFTPEAIQQLKHDFGLDRSLGVQFLCYMRNLLRFDLGLSFSSMRPVIDEITERLPNTIVLMGTALVATMISGVMVGVYAAARRGSAAEMTVTASSLFAFAMPTFFLQLLLLLLFGYYIPIFPVRGTISAPPPPGFFMGLLDRIHHLILPAGSLVLLNLGQWSLYTKNAMLEALAQDYVVTAKAKGLSRRRILYAHALRSILPPIVTLAFLQLPGLVSGAVVTESIFSWHGIGRYLLDAIMQMDYPAAQGAFYFIALAVIVSNFVADLVYGLVDPRIRVGAGERR